MEHRATPRYPRAQRNCKIARKEQNKPVAVTLKPLISTNDNKGKGKESQAKPKEKVTKENFRPN
jgi:hypothetical protein